MPVTAEYVENLPEIYHDLLGAFPRFDATRKSGSGLAFQSLYSALEGKYTIGEIILACEEMQRGGAIEIRNDIFAHPTPAGEDLIAKITRGDLPPAVPPFPPLAAK
jgi:hypothetical protein